MSFNLVPVAPVIVAPVNVALVNVAPVSAAPMSGRIKCGLQRADGLCVKLG